MGAEDRRARFSGKVPFVQFGYPAELPSPMKKMTKPVPSGSLRTVGLCANGGSTTWQTMKFDRVRSILL
jgi:hypothetical protein